MGNAGHTGFALEDGGLKLYSSGLTSVNPYDIVHGPYVISQTAKQINAGDKVEFDWKSAGTDDAASIYAYLLNVDTGATIELINFTQSTDGVTTDWAKTPQILPQRVIINSYSSMGHMMPREDKR